MRIWMRICDHWSSDPPGLQILQGSILVLQSSVVIVKIKLITLVRIRVRSRNPDCKCNYLYLSVTISHWLPKVAGKNLSRFFYRRRLTERYFIMIGGFLTPL